VTEVPTMTPGILATRAVLHDHREERGDTEPEVRARLEAMLVDEVMVLARTDEERAAVREATRPGTWWGDQCGDGRRLTQRETDILIRCELSSSLRYMLGDVVDVSARAVLGEHRMLKFVVKSERKWRMPVAESASSPDERASWRKVLATMQRGGIDSDPLVRLLAWRVWGERDVSWFKDRGLRVGDRVTVLANNTVACAWDHEAAFAGRALKDAWPGQRPTIDGAELNGQGWRNGTPRDPQRLEYLSVSQRLRPLEDGRLGSGVTYAQRVAQREFERANRLDDPSRIILTRWDDVEAIPDSPDDRVDALAYGYGWRDPR